jgi:hypothetical protein
MRMSAAHPFIGFWAHCGPTAYRHGCHAMPDAICAIMLTGARSRTHLMADRWFSSSISPQLRAIRGRGGAAGAAHPRLRSSYARLSACSSRLLRQAKCTGRLAAVQGNLIRNPVPQRPARTDPNDGACIGIGVTRWVAENAPHAGITAGAGRDLRDVAII